MCNYDIYRRAPSSEIKESILEEEELSMYYDSTNIKILAKSTQSEYRLEALEKLLTSRRNDL